MKMTPEVIKVIHKITLWIAFVGGFGIFAFLGWVVCTDRDEFIIVGLIIWAIICVPTILINFWSYCYYPGKENELVPTHFGSQMVTRRNLFKLACIMLGLIISGVIFGGIVSLFES